MPKRSWLAKAVLLPCSKVYGAITYLRNKLFDWNALKGVEFDIPVICVGNLAVGGTGKTPHVEYLRSAQPWIQALHQGFHYGRTHVYASGYRRRVVYDIS